MVINFPPFFTFAVCRFQREKACSRVRQQRKYLFLKFSVRSATIISLCLSPVMFYLFFYANLQTDQSTVIVYTKGKKKVRESEPMFGCHLHKNSKLCSYVKTTKGNYIQPVTNILVKS